MMANQRCVNVEGPALDQLQLAGGLARHRLDRDRGAATDRLVFYLIGVLLAATAIAKLWMLLTDSFADIRVGIPSEILWISVVLELWLAYENFRVRDCRLLALINTIVFAAFGVFAVLRLVLGYGSCGCSGNIEIPAWVFIAIDFSIVSYFLPSVRRRSAIFEGWTVLQKMWLGWSAATKGRLVGLCLFAVLMVGMQLSVAAPVRTLILGQPPVQARVTIDDELTVDQQQTCQVIIRNGSLTGARIVGVSRSCRCFDIEADLASVAIAANENVVFPLVIKPEKPGPIQQRVVLFIDHPDQFRVNVDLIGFVKGVE